MSKKYLVKHVGIGDLIFFCGTILFNHKKGDTIEFCLSKEILGMYRENSQDYEKFCYEYVKYFLNDYEIKILPNESESNYNWIVDYDLFNKIINNAEVLNQIKNKLNIQKTKYENYLVLFTKVRDLDKTNYFSVCDHFYDYINKFDGKIILLGEKNIIYKGEYAIHGKNKIYSIYDDCINKISEDKIIDLTTSVYDFKNFSLENILNDMSIISNSEKTFIFGGGGFFCLSLFTNKLVSLTNNLYKSAFYSKENLQIFDENEEFRKNLSYL